MWTNIGTYYVRHAQSGKQSPTKKTPTSIAAFDIDHTIIKPKHNKIRVLKEGLRFLGDLELQDNRGIFFICKNIDMSIKCTKYTQTTY